MTICDGDTVTIGGSPSGSGGTGALTYTWLPNTSINDNSLSNPDIFPTGSTNYILEVEDINNCAATDSVLVSVNPSPTAIATTLVNIICDGGTTALDATGSNGGTGLLSFLWSPPLGLDNPTSDSPNASPTITTAYIVTVTDQNSCIGLDTLTITVNPNPIIDLTSMVLVNENCGTSNGSITGITATGIPTLTYDWDDGSGSVGSGLDLTPIAAGSYTLTVTDGNGCTAQSGPIVINNIAGPGIIGLGMVNTPDTCGQSVGGITGLTITGGAGTLTYDWSDGSSSVGSSLDLTNVTAGVYTLTVTDSAGCSITSILLVISEISGPTVDLTGQVNAADTCGQLVGSITGTIASGGTSPYTYSWDDGSSVIGTNADLTGLGVGSYNLTISDNAGCTVTGGPYVIVDVPAPTLDLTGIVVANAHCGQSDGNITGVIVIGGSGTISYSWDDGTAAVGTAADLLNVLAGNYTLTVTDNAGCSSTGTPVAVLDLPGPTLNAGAVVIALSSCGGSDGSITGINISGGSFPYNYTWSDGTSTVGTSLNLLSQPAGTYTVTVTDGNGCTDTSGPYTISEFGAPTIDATAIIFIPETCDSINGSIGGITVSGGTAPISYSWSDGTSIIDTNQRRWSTGNVFSQY